MEPLRLEVVRTGEAVDVQSRELFGSISCSIYSWARAEEGGSTALRYIWRAHCPDRIDCARSVRYGDARLQTEIQAMPLIPSVPGECYLCSTRSDRGRGTARFTVGPDGTIARCPKRP